MNVKIVLSEGVSVPQYKTVGSAGCDLCAAQDGRVWPGMSSVVPTGIKVSIPPGHEGQVRSRSGLAAKNTVFVLNSPGTIDSDYTGEICVILMNVGHVPFSYRKGDRIAQLVIAPVIQAEFEAVDCLEKTERGAGGFGSTGI